MPNLSFYVFDYGCLLFQLGGESKLREEQDFVSVYVCEPLSEILSSSKVTLDTNKDDNSVIT